MLSITGRVYALIILWLIFGDNLHAVELTIATDNAPPHVIENIRGGIDLDITVAVLSTMGHSVTVQFMPLLRGKQQVIKKQSDLFLPTFFEKDSELLFISDAIIEYRPTFFTHTNSDFVVESVADLMEKKVVTFQGASKYFGAEFLAMSKVNKHYRELPSMSLLPELLLKRRYDVVLLDYYIFYYFLDPHHKTDIKEHEVFDSVNAHVGFNDKKLRDKFNEHLKAFKQQAAYQNIINSYLGL